MIDFTKLFFFFCMCTQFWIEGVLRFVTPKRDFGNKLDAGGTVGKPKLIIPNISYEIILNI